MCNCPTRTAVLGDVIPAAVLVEVVDADDISADIFIRAGFGGPLFPSLHPAIPAVRPRDRNDVVARRIDSVDVHLVAGTQRHLAASRRDGRLTAPNRDAGVA